jgi:16S rRNA (guanine527-N7)-methyltransferase
MSSAELRGLLEAHVADFSAAQLDRATRFHEILVRENQVQNLTRLISPRDFYEGHFLDVLEAQRSGLLDGSRLDLGSGCGVPGLLGAALGQKGWSLVDSEGRKAEFLKMAALELGIDVPVFSGRGEKVLGERPFDQVVARAVGTVEKVYSWIGGCSTWNTLLLFKGKGWEEEWRGFLQSKHRRHLEVEKIHAYSVGVEAKQRLIIRLKRAVPRRT